MIKYLGRFWNDRTKGIYKIDEKNIVLNKFDGEKYYDCFELDGDLIGMLNNNIEVLPQFKINKNGDAILVNFIIL